MGTSGGKKYVSFLYVWVVLQCCCVQLGHRLARIVNLCSPSGDIWGLFSLCNLPQKRICALVRPPMQLSGSYVLDLCLRALFMLCFAAVR